MKMLVTNIRIKKLIQESIFRVILESKDNDLIEKIAQRFISTGKVDIPEDISHGVLKAIHQKIVDLGNEEISKKEFIKTDSRGSGAMSTEGMRKLFLVSLRDTMVNVSNATLNPLNTSIKLREAEVSVHKIIDDAFTKSKQALLQGFVKSGLIEKGSTIDSFKFSPGIPFEIERLIDPSFNNNNLNSFLSLNRCFDYSKIDQDKLQKHFKASVNRIGMNILKTILPAGQFQNTFGKTDVKTKDTGENILELDMQESIKSVNPFLMNGFKRQVEHEISSSSKHLSEFILKLFLEENKLMSAIIQSGQDLSGGFEIPDFRNPVPQFDNFKLKLFELLEDQFCRTLGVLSSYKYLFAVLVDSNPIDNIKTFNQVLSADLDSGDIRKGKKRKELKKYSLGDAGRQLARRAKKFYTKTMKEKLKEFTSVHYPSAYSGGGNVKDTLLYLKKIGNRKSTNETSGIPYPIGFAKIYDSIGLGTDSNLKGSSPIGLKLGGFITSVYNRDVGTDLTSADATSFGGLRAKRDEEDWTKGQMVKYAHGHAGGGLSAEDRIDKFSNTEKDAILYDLDAIRGSFPNGQYAECLIDNWRIEKVFSVDWYNLPGKGEKNIDGDIFDSIRIKHSNCVR